jgi:hypothetical protein
MAEDGAETLEFSFFSYVVLSVPVNLMVPNNPTCIKRFSGAW